MKALVLGTYQQLSDIYIEGLSDARKHVNSWLNLVGAPLRYGGFVHPQLRCQPKAAFILFGNDGLDPIVLFPGHLMLLPEKYQIKATVIFYIICIKSNFRLS